MKAGDEVVRARAWICVLELITTLVFEERIMPAGVWRGL
jgi:hypothetical protein